MTKQDKPIEQLPVQASFTLTAGITMQLRELSAQRGISQSELVRQLLTYALSRTVAE